MEVTALLYSGRPNPSWRVGDSVAATVLARLAAMPGAPAAVRPAPGLGYAGLLVVLDEAEGEAGEWHIAAGVAHGPKGDFIDAGRTVERLLLAEAERQGVRLPPGLA